MQFDINSILQSSFTSSINIISLMLMILVFSTILENIESFKERRGSMLYIYISMLASVLHGYKWMQEMITKEEAINFSIVIFTISLIFAIISETFAIFYGHESRIKSNKKRNTYKVYEQSDNKNNLSLNQIKESIENVEKNINGIKAQRVNKDLYQKDKTHPYSKMSFDTEIPMENKIIIKQDNNDYSTLTDKIKEQNELTENSIERLKKLKNEYQ